MDREKMRQEIERIKEIIGKSKCSREVINSEEAGMQVPILSAICKALSIPLESNETNEDCNCPTCINWSRAELFDNAGLILEYQERLMELSNKWAKETKEIDKTVGRSSAKTKEVTEFFPPTEEEINKLLASLETSNDLRPNTLEDVADEGEFADDSQKIRYTELPLAVSEAKETKVIGFEYKLAS